MPRRRSRSEASPTPEESRPQRSLSAAPSLPRADAATPETDETELTRIARPLPLVTQVEQILREAIAAESFPGGRLPTEVDLADQLGVSRETVRKAAEVLQQEGLLVKYRRRGTFVRQPEEPMRLQTGRPRLVGYVQADYGTSTAQPESVTRVLGSLMRDGAVTEAGRQGYEVIVRSARPLDIQQAVTQLLGGYRPAGVIYASVAEEKLLKRMTGHNLPTVLLDHDLNVPRVSSVRTDSRQNSQLAVAHLASLGHRRIACALWHQVDLNPWFVRGYRQGMQEAGLPRRRKWEFPVELTPAGGRQAVEQLLALSPRPTAIVCFHNTLACAVLQAAREMGLQVPEDLSVMGGGGETVVGLTCCQLDWFDMGRQGMRLLLERVTATASGNTHLVLPYGLEPGWTTASPSADNGLPA